MKVNDKVRLNQDIGSVHMFPAKGQLPDSLFIQAGTEGEVEEAFSSGAGIVSFSGKRVLFMNLESKLTKLTK